MRKTGLLSISGVVIAGAIILAGCSGGGGDSVADDVKPVDLAKSVVENMAKEKGYTINQGIDFQAKVSAQGVNADMKMNVEFGGDVSQSPKVATHLKGKTSMSLFSQSQEREMEMYIVADDSATTATMYSTSDGSTWNKTTTNLSSATSVYSPSIYQAVVDGKADATLSKKLEKINGKDAYKLEVTLNGDTLKDALAAVSAGGNSVLSTSSVDLSKASIAANVYIYKDNKLPAKVDLDLKSLGSSLMGSLGNQSNVEVEKFEINMDFKDYGEKTITVPDSIINSVDKNN